MNEIVFDDSRLEEPSLEAHEALRWLATAGARIRRAALTGAHGGLERGDRPRGILVLGAEARLVRAVLEPACPVPFMAWPGPGLPAWLGPLDLTVVLGDDESPEWVVHCAAEAARRGSALIVAAPPGSRLAGMHRSSTLVATVEADPLAAAVAVLAQLGQLALGPLIHPGHVADAADLVAEACAPSRDLAANPGKELALAMADRVPLIWGGTVLAGRASRRIAEAVRRACGRPALAADADEFEVLLRSCRRADPFADPFEEQAEARPVLVLLDDDKLPAGLTDPVRRLVGLADSVGVRVARISSGEADIAASDVERYVTLLQQGLYGAAYLGIGLGD